MYGLDDYASAIGQIESGNNWGTIGPVTRNGDRAYGRFQVMGANVPDWTKRYYGTELNVHQFLNNPEAQRAVFNGEFGRALSRYGNPNDAASVWFSGRPLAQAANSSDGWINTQQYVDRFNKALGGPAPATPAPQPQETAMPDQGGLYDQSGPDIGAALSGIGAGLVTAVNPGAGAQLQQNFNQMLLANRPKTQVLTDMFGQQHVVAIDPRTGMPIVNGAKALAAAQGASNGASGFTVPSDFAEAVGKYNKGEISGEDLKNAAPGPVLQLAQDYIKGTGDPRVLGMGRGSAGMRAAAVTLAHTMDPNFDDTKIEERRTVQRSLGNASPTQLGGQFQSANTLMNHTASLYDDIDKMEALGLTGKMSYWNKVKQLGAQYVPGLIDEKAQAVIADFDKHRQAVASELTRLTRGGNGSLKEVEDWKHGMDSADSIAGLRSNAAAVIDLMRGRVQSGVDRVNQAFGTNKTIENYLSAPAQAAIGRVGADVAQYQPGAAPASPATPAAPKVGTVMKGYRFKGGNPADPNSWEKQ